MLLFHSKFTPIKSPRFSVDGMLVNLVVASEVFASELLCRTRHYQNKIDYR
ncbi:hypothetical protein appser4_20730 [Actinobacillus pleuropneumoniae serovar 4 str. M62]|nr:hypothetical protein appser4_20730 [Actinobacillus pleuropneumoniae serovar 4 str. M62]